MNLIFESDALRVSYINRHTAEVCMCFSGIGRHEDKLDEISEEFYSISSLCSAIFIIDKNRSWGNDLNFSELGDVLKPYINNKKIYTLGNSMGGFLAILATQFFNISTAIAFAPQFSIHKSIVEEEDRFDKYSNKISEWKYLSLDGSFNNQTKYYIFAGAGRLENIHLKLLPTAPNIVTIVFLNPTFDHKVAQQLKNKKILTEVIYDCFSNISTSELITRWFPEDDFIIDSNLGYKN
jgi:hypothetical protein